MIEVIYDKDKDEANSKGDKEKSGEATFKLPKNIRQVGTPASGKRIYIEDYVVTYLNYISRPGSTNARGAVLLGECKKMETGDVIFISGAVDAENLEFDMDESEFTQEAWTEIYENVKEFFPDLNVVGWFLSRMGFSTAINEKIEKMHVENFPGKEKVLYITDSLECEDAFYMYEKGQLVKQKGYYIYYVKNELMQNYIVKKRGGIPEEQNTEIHRKDEELIKSYRQKTPMKQRHSTPNMNLAYVAGSFVVIAMLAMGVSVVNNYDKMHEMEVSLNRLELTAEENKKNDAAQAMASTENNTEAPSSESVATPNEPASVSDAGAAMPSRPETPSTEEKKPISTANSDNENISTEQTLPTITSGNPTYYTIKYGDSLSSISLEYYGSIGYASKIAQANNMKLDDKIYDGQVIVIPTVNPEE